MNTLESYKVALVDVQAICDTEHYWQPGVYIRKMLGRAHHIFIGAEHKEVHTNIIVSGSFDLSVNGGSYTEAPGSCNIYFKYRGPEDSLLSYRYCVVKYYE